jgi:hypothetical protein
MTFGFARGLTKGPLSREARIDASLARQFTHRTLPRFRRNQEELAQHGRGMLVAERLVDPRAARREALARTRRAALSWRNPQLSIAQHPQLRRAVASSLTRGDGARGAERIGLGAARTATPPPELGR